jgi:hypothetical protein
MKAFYCRFVKTESGARSPGKRNHALFELYRLVEQSHISGEYVRSKYAELRVNFSESIGSQPAYCTSIPDADAGQMRLNAGLDRNP